MMLVLVAALSLVDMMAYTVPMSPGGFLTFSDLALPVTSTTTTTYIAIFWTLAWHFRLYEFA